jgi:hypothetical protein
MMEAVCTSEMSDVRFQVLTVASMKFRVFWLTTRQYIPEDSELHDYMVVYPRRLSSCLTLIIWRPSSSSSSHFSGK